MCRGLRVFLLLAILAPFRLPGAESPPTKYDRVEVAATWTSIYIGTVSLKMPAFTRAASGDFESTYSARVFPYFMYSEHGRLSIRISDEALGKLERGEPIEFTGRAVNQENEERRVEGKATPASAAGGKIKVRVFVSPRVELIFNTTYRFPDK